MPNPYMLPDGSIIDGSVIYPIENDILTPFTSLMIESGEIKIPRTNIGQMDNNLFQINRWLAYEIDDSELYERVIAENI